MNTETIKDFIRKNLEVTYYEIAEETMLLNPIIGVMEKFIKENNIQEEKIRNERLEIQAHNAELQKRAEEMQKKEEQINQFLNQKPEQEYINYSDEHDKIQEIKKIICEYFDVNIDRKTRLRYVVYARQMAMYYSRILTKLSLATIGSFIGGKDHATVLHSMKVIENLKRYWKTKNDIKKLNKIFSVNEP